LLVLDPTTDCFSFQTFDDAKERSNPRLARILHGSLADHRTQLVSLNARGAGVFICVNATDLKGRGARHIKKLRGIWQDDDHGWQGKFPLAPSLVVSTSPGRFQRLWLCDGLTLHQHRAVQERLAVSFGHDRQACGVNRVLRLPGFRHMKNPNAPHLVRIVGGDGRRYSGAQILAAFPPVAKQSVAPPRRWLPRTDDDHRVRDALRLIPADDRETWWRVGAALKSHFGDVGRGLWDSWSASSEKYDPRTQERIWKSFRRSGVTIATIFHLAREHSRVAQS
jgi:hypothetical protein